MSKGMSEKRKAFCEYYCGECKGNTAQAALKAGYSKSYAYAMAYKLLENIEIQQYIKQLNDEVRSQRIASIEEIQEYWTSVMRDDEQKQADRLSASIQLGKCKGMFNDW